MFILYMKLTKNELKVIEQLYHNSRESRNIIAKKCNISRSGLDKMINKLLDKKIIRFKTIVNYTKLGMNYYKILINIQNLKFDKIKIIKIIKKLNIECIFLLDGTWDLEIIIATSKTDILQKEILKIKEKYSDDIESLKIIIISQINYSFPYTLKKNLSNKQNKTIFP